jgi:hypothetical protein
VGFSGGVGSAADACALENSNVIADAATIQLFNFLGGACRFTKGERIPLLCRSPATLFYCRNISFPSVVDVLMRSPLVRLVLDLTRGWPHDS